MKVCSLSLSAHPSTAIYHALAKYLVLSTTEILCTKYQYIIIKSLSGKTSTCLIFAYTPWLLQTRDIKRRIEPGCSCNYVGMDLFPATAAGRTWPYYILVMVIWSFTTFYVLWSVPILFHRLSEMTFAHAVSNRALRYISVEIFNFRYDKIWAELGFILLSSNSFNWCFD